MKKENNTADQVTAPETEASTPEKKPTKRTWVTGVVSNCKKLHIRKEADKRSQSIMVVDMATELKVNVKKSTKDWYSVKTTSGVEGFCMKEYITVEE